MLLNDCDTISPKTVFPTATCDIFWPFYSDLLTTFDASFQLRLSK